jgi:uncharacterized membrane protein YqaE (UPF0057 family)
MAKLLTSFLVLFLTQPIFAAYHTSSNLMQEPSVVNSLDEFRNLSTKEKRERLKEVKKEIKKHKQNPTADERVLLLLILSILLPPLAVYLHQGEINSKFWISLILTFIFWIPGVVYAMLLVLDQIS